MDKEERINQITKQVKIYWNEYHAISEQRCLIVVQKIFM